MISSVIHTEYWYLNLNIDLLIAFIKKLIRSPSQKLQGKKEQELELKKTNQVLDKAQDEVRELKKKLAKMEKEGGSGPVSTGPVVSSGGDNSDVVRRLEERIMDLEAQLGSSSSLQVRIWNLG